MINWQEKYKELEEQYKNLQQSSKIKACQEKNHALYQIRKRLNLRLDNLERGMSRHPDKEFMMALIDQARHDLAREY